MVKITAALLLLALALPALAGEATSLLGCTLTPAPPPADNPHEAALAVLRERLARDPADADAAIWLGRRLGYLGRYREAVEVFTAGLIHHPGDARLLRHRGHRHLTLRQLDEALADFEAAAAAMVGRPDEVEQDGLPNLFNQPTSTLKTNIWYHLGLTYYLRGDFYRASEAFASCLALADNADMAIAAGYWRYLTLRRQPALQYEAANLLANPILKAPVIENTDYQNLLALFRGERKRDTFAVTEGATVASATVAYGLALQLSLEGHPAEAFAAYQQILKGAAWPAFGYLAAEAELARGGFRGDCR